MHIFIVKTDERHQRGLRDFFAKISPESLRTIAKSAPYFFYVLSSLENFCTRLHAVESNFFNWLFPAQPAISRRDASGIFYGNVGNLENGFKRVPIVLLKHFK